MEPRISNPVSIYFPKKIRALQEISKRLSSFKKTRESASRYMSSPGASQRSAFLDEIFRRKSSIRPELHHQIVPQGRKPPELILGNGRSGRKYDLGRIDGPSVSQNPEIQVRAG